MDQLTLNRFRPALSGWLSQTCWKTRAPVGAYTSTSTSAVAAVALFTKAVSEALPPRATLLGETVALLENVGVTVGTAVLVGTAVGVSVALDVGVAVAVEVAVGVEVDIGVGVA